MQKTIKQLYSKHIYPVEQVIPEDKEYREKGRINGEWRERFKNNLPDSMKADFEAMFQSCLEVTLMEEEQSFVNGFRLGARLMLEIMTEDKG